MSDSVSGIPTIVNPSTSTGFIKIFFLLMYYIVKWGIIFGLVTGTIPLGKLLSGTKSKIELTEKAKINDRRIFEYCLEFNKKTPINIFIFGHSHIANKRLIKKNSVYFNCGEWINNSFYLESNGNKYELKEFN